MAETKFQAVNNETREIITGTWELLEILNLDKRLWEITGISNVPKSHKVIPLKNGKEPIGYIKTYCINRFFYCMEGIWWMPVYGLSCLTKIKPKTSIDSFHEFQKLFKDLHKGRAV